MIAREEAFVSVNGVTITQAQINQELLSYSAKSQDGALRKAIRTLVVRELLIQEAVNWGLCDRDSVINHPQVVIDKLLAVQIKVPEPDDASCERYFNENKANFSTAPLCEASHIFFPAPQGDQKARDEARDKANSALAKVKDNPGCFNEVARLESICSSAVNGGSLGAVTKGQTVPAFESALMSMNEGDISEEPVETEVGFHIIRVDERVEAESLPFDVFKSWICQHLSEQRRNKAVSGYVKGLADKAEIRGFDFGGEQGS